MKAALIALLGAFALVAGAPAASASLVTEWNALALNYVRAMRTPPPVAARMLAILHASIFDAVNGISPSYQYYIVPSSLAPRAASVNAAASGAARDALNALFPGFASQTNQTFEAKLIASLDSPAAEAAGVAWGVQVAAAVLANRTDDGSQHIDYSLPDLAPGIWIPTPPAYADPLLPCWGSVTPFAVPAIPGGGILNAKNVSDDSDDDSSIDDLDGTAGPFAVTKAPPALGSNRYASELLEVQSLGAIDSRTRTEDQTNVAKFWAQNAGTSTPPGMWQDIASQILAQRAAAGHPYPLVDQARLYAVLTAAQADAAISCWWSKYQFWRWRPITAIQQANSSLNKRMPAANPTWQPLLPTPPFPTYTSGHSTFSGASAQVLADFFGSDVASFTVTTEWPGVPPRTFRSFSEAADEAGMSRIYGGIHFDRDNVPALKVGRKIGRYAFKRVMKPLRN